MCDRENPDGCGLPMRVGADLEERHFHRISTRYVMLQLPEIVPKPVSSGLHPVGGDHQTGRSPRFSDGIDRPRACGEKTRTFANSGVLNALGTGLGGNFERRRDGAIPCPGFSRAGCRALGSVTGKRMAACRHLLRSCSMAAGVTSQTRSGRFGSGL